jgi:hypothetical protein
MGIEQSRGGNQVAARNHPFHLVQPGHPLFSMQ